MKRSDIISAKKTIKSVGGFYTTTDFLDARRNFFFVDRINLLKTFGKFVQVLDLDYGDPSFITEILNKTSLKSIKIYRVPTSVSKESYFEEEVLIGNFGISDAIQGFQFSTKSTGISANSDPVVISSMNLEKKLIIPNTGIEMINFNDFFARNSLKDSFKYKIEIEYHDGLKPFYDKKVSNYKKRISSFDKLVTQLNNKKYLTNVNVEKASRGKNIGFNLAAIESSTPAIFNGANTAGSSESNLQLIDRQIRTAISYYLELKTIINPKSSQIAKQAFDNFYKLLNIRSATIHELTKFNSEFQRIYSKFEQQVNLYFQSADSTESSKTSRKNKSSKNLSVVYYSPKIDKEVNYGKLSFIRPTQNLVELPIVNKTQLSSRLSPNGNLSGSKDMKIGNKIYDSLNSTRIKKALVESFLKNFMGSDNTLKATKFDSQAENKVSLTTQQFRERTNLLLAFSSIGVSFPQSNTGNSKNLVQKPSSKTVDSKQYISNSSNSFNSVTSNENSLDKQVDLQFSEVVNSLEDLVNLEDVVIGYALENSNLESKKIRSDFYGTYLDKLFLGSRIEVLQGFKLSKAKRKTANNFDPSWVTLNNEELGKLKKGTYLMCRIVNDLNPKTTLNVERALNFITINKFFILEGN